VTSPDAVAFDVIGTLLDLSPLAARLSSAGVSPSVLTEWYERTLRDGFALSLAGDYVSFADVAASALRAITGLPGSAVSSVLSGFSGLPAYPDAMRACKRLADEDTRIVLLTNGAAKPVSAFAAQSGLSAFVSRVISIDEVRRWKPAAIVYRYAAELLDVPLESFAFVSAHPWDVHGAKRAGLLTAHVARDDGSGFPGIFAAPDVSAPDLVTAIESLLSL
jgi:2-haloacid dehalogenase